MPLIEASDVRASKGTNLRISTRCLTAPAIFVFCRIVGFDEANRSIRQVVSPAEVQTVAQLPPSLFCAYLIVSAVLGGIAFGSSPAAKPANNGSMADQFMVCV